MEVRRKINLLLEGLLSRYRLRPNEALTLRPEGIFTEANRRVAANPLKDLVKRTLTIRLDSYESGHLYGFLGKVVEIAGKWKRLQIPLVLHDFLPLLLAKAQNEISLIEWEKNFFCLIGNQDLVRELKMLIIKKAEEPRQLSGWVDEFLALFEKVKSISSHPVNRAKIRFAATQIFYIILDKANSINEFQGFAEKVLVKFNSYDAILMQNRLRENQELMGIENFIFEHLAFFVAKSTTPLEFEKWEGQAREDLGRMNQLYGDRMLGCYGALVKKAHNSAALREWSENFFDGMDASFLAEQVISDEEIDLIDEVIDRSNSPEDLKALLPDWVRLGSSLIDSIQ